ncbi:tRNA uridine-5-carboxymethylaminomethyl(34) synthesis enzyme MnmG [Eubacterium coprostanoligenes]|uniref:tRNA uridine-5-carboxymethylaminomethyl(34) synthesis enzyme MnmG n=1 Tax=Eubacterium coprostanoligenes TaxID=290054 RepID=UPI002354B149|nr:tRNA uridine-5-carboxymethylaminomethyl(34) synthesis enzyme MnmG [Eubacterium coprostanoligenes]MCI6253958.1 tRNA uridine-5-carboxymethylaminomethyl(34) synthesis enzyme MnmG [Eubacterium coprostanoligenes]MDY5399919.1 tRNA uridine-5-carboxymethylaminomethyl(34) synthesis enzyme MnmG [Eubacterium coprostanoligenes]
MEYFGGKYDVIVIGAGHAGIEAALASARLGVKTAVFTINLDWVGNMPCNPSIGGTSKGHLVREIDALGGEMGKAADKYSLQSRMLNLGKGPAVHSLRAQIDRREYSAGMKHTLELTDNLDIRQGEIIDLYKDDDEWVVKTRLEALFSAKAVIIATGTFLGGRVYIGDVTYESGPDGMFPANELSKALYKLNIPLRRFKTGTPSRVNRRSIDFDGLDVQEGDEVTVPFSFETDKRPENKVVCHITYSNEKTKQIILDNLDRSPMYSGKIEGKGPRYCPSFEDKIVRFADKERHQLFIEPCGENTEEMYLQGLSSSLPEDVQLAFIHTIKGLEHAQVMRAAYAIEYDCVDPTALKATLEFLDIPGLYGAGQFNGSSGYEEAAAQGLVAGINAALKIKGEEPLILDRGGSYIGTLIDDLVTKGCSDPYRMMTSRSEYRLVLRQDNADIRLTPTGHKIGLISDERFAKFCKKQELIKEEFNRVKNLSVPMSDEVQQILTSKGTVPLKTGCKMIELLRRPQITYDDLKTIDVDRPELPLEVFEQVEISIKYEGYIKKQEAQIKEMRRIEAKQIPADIDYSTLKGLRLEAIEKLSKIRPQNLGQASRISGVNPADITALNIILESMHND